MVMDQVTSFALARVNEALPDSLFAFVPPQGAKLVQTLRPAGRRRGPVPAGRQARPALHAQGCQGQHRLARRLQGQGRAARLLGHLVPPVPHRDAARRGALQGVQGQGPGGLRRQLRRGSRHREELPRARTRTRSPSCSTRRARSGGLYEADAIPTLVVIGKDGKISSYFQGVREETCCARPWPRRGSSSGGADDRAHAGRRLAAGAAPPVVSRLRRISAVNPPRTTPPRAPAPRSRRRG